MRYRIRTITPLDDIPLPLTLAEAKKELRVDLAEGVDAAEDALILAKLRSAMDYAERFTGQVLSPREFELSLDGFPCSPELVELPREPVTAVASVKYSDPSTGAEVTLDGADWRWSDADPGLLRPAFGAWWPSAASERGSVRVRFTAGYEAGLAPPALVAAVKLLMAHLYANREAVVVGTTTSELPLGLVDMCRPFRRVLI